MAKKHKTISKERLPLLVSALSRALDRANPGIGPGGDPHWYAMRQVDPADARDYLQERRIPSRTARSILRKIEYFCTRSTRVYVWSHNATIHRIQYLREDPRRFLAPYIKIR